MDKRLEGFINALLDKYEIVEEDLEDDYQRLAWLVQELQAEAIPSLLTSNQAAALAGVSRQAFHDMRRRAVKAGNDVGHKAADTFWLFSREDVYRLYPEARPEVAE